jgi:hypothetical protein
MEFNLTRAILSFALRQNRSAKTLAMNTLKVLTDLIKCLNELDSARKPEGLVKESQLSLQLRWSRGKLLGRAYQKRQF